MKKLNKISWLIIAMSINFYALASDNIGSSDLNKTSSLCKQLTDNPFAIPVGMYDCDKFILVLSKKNAKFKLTDNAKITKVVINTVGGGLFKHKQVAFNKDWFEFLMPQKVFDGWQKINYPCFYNLGSAALKLVISYYNGTQKVSFGDISNRVLTYGGSNISFDNVTGKLVQQMVANNSRLFKGCLFKSTVGTDVYGKFPNAIVDGVFSFDYDLVQSNDITKIRKKTQTFDNLDILLQSGDTIHFSKIANSAKGFEAINKTKFIRCGAANLTDGINAYSSNNGYIPGITGSILGQIPLFKGRVNNNGFISVNSSNYRDLPSKKGIDKCGSGTIAVTIQLENILATAKLD